MAGFLWKFKGIALGISYFKGSDARTCKLDTKVFQVELATNIKQFDTKYQYEDIK